MMLNDGKFTLEVSTFLWGILVIYRDPCMDLRYPPLFQKLIRMSSHSEMAWTFENQTNKKWASTNVNYSAYDLWGKKWSWIVCNNIFLGCLVLIPSYATRWKHQGQLVRIQGFLYISYIIDVSSRTYQMCETCSKYSNVKICRRSGFYSWIDLWNHQPAWINVPKRTPHHRF